MTFFLRPLHCMLALVLLALAACTPVSEAPQLRVIATDPGAEAMLGPQQRFHIQFSVVSKIPVVVMLDPYFQQQALSANLGTSAPVTLPAGGGTAVAHLFFWGDYATRVDAIRLVARAPKQTQTLAELTLPVKLSWVAREVAPREPAAWVTAAPAPASAAPAPDERSQWLAFGLVIAAIALGGFGSRWLRKRRRARREA